MISTWPWPMRLHIIFGTLSVLIGGALILGGHKRASASAYYFIDTVGGPYVWGLAFATIGVVTLAAGKQYLVMRWSLLAGAIAYGIMSWAFCMAAIVSSSANYTAMIVYGWVAVVQLLMHSNMWKCRSKHRKGKHERKTPPKA